VVVPHGQDVIPRRPRGGASCKGVISQRPRGDVSLLGHNSTASWWCLIKRIRIVKSWCFYIVWYLICDVCYLCLNMKSYV